MIRHIAATIPPIPIHVPTIPPASGKHQDEVLLFIIIFIFWLGWQSHKRKGGGHRR